jgi:hypothetical protein
MTESEAFERAISHIKSRGATYTRFFATSMLTEKELHLLGDEGTRTLPGSPTKVWRFSFKIQDEKELMSSPDVTEIVVSGNHFDVLVDDDTGACGIFWRL